MDQNNNQNVQTTPIQNTPVNQSNFSQPVVNQPVTNQPIANQPVISSKPSFVLDEKMLNLLTSIGISGGLGFCCYFFIFLIGRLLSKISIETHPNDFFDTTLYGIYSFINSYVLVWFPIIVIGLSLFLLLKNKKK